MFPIGREYVHYSFLSLVNFIPGGRGGRGGGRGGFRGGGRGGFRGGRGGGGFRGGSRGGGGFRGMVFWTENMLLLSGMLKSLST